MRQTESPTSRRQVRRRLFETRTSGGASRARAYYRELCELSPNLAVGRAPSAPSGRNSADADAAAGEAAAAKAGSANSGSGTAGASSIAGSYCSAAASSSSVRRLRRRIANPRPIRPSSPMPTAPAIGNMSADMIDPSCAGRVATTGATTWAGGGGAATGPSAASTGAAGVGTGAATGAATGARAAGAATLAGRATLAARWVGVDLLDFGVVVVGSGAIGALTLLVDGSVGIVTAGALSGTAVDGATATGGVAVGAAWARSWAEDNARTTAIAVVARRIPGVLWVMI